MSEYPERIWAAENRQTHSTMWWPDDAGGVGVEYVRADRIEELQAEVNGAHEIILSERAEVLRLRERIKELEADLEEAIQTAERAGDLLNRMDEARLAAEAKLEKAVEALTSIDDFTCHNMPMTARDEQAVNREARAALAQVKGQADE